MLTVANGTISHIQSRHIINRTPWKPAGGGILDPDGNFTSKFGPIQLQYEVEANKILVHRSSLHTRDSGGARSANIII